MLEQNFVDRIEELRHNTYSTIIDLQKNLCPMVRNIYMNYQFEYWYDGYKYTLWEEDTHVYAVKDLPYCYDNDIKNTTFIDTLDNLVKNDVIFPFLLFINGLAIRWSRITVIHDYDYTYLKINDFTPNESFSTDIVVFPLGSKNVRYGEDNGILISDPNKKGFYFDETGHRLTEEQVAFTDVYLRFEILEDTMYYKEVDIPSLEDELEFEDLPIGYIPTLDNILIFDKDGLFMHGEVEKSFGNKFNSAFGLFNKLSTSSSSASVAILMYNTRANNTSARYLTKSDLNKDKVKEFILDGKDEDDEYWNTYIAPLISHFDFTNKFGVAYEDSIDKDADYIVKYDYALFNDAFMKDIPIKSFTYTGSDYKKLADNKGYIHYSRKHTDLLEDVVIVFVNNKIYPYSIDITYTSNTINIPVFGVLDEDHVEIVMFTECNNTVLDIVVPNNYTEVYINNAYPLDDVYLMYDECADPSYDVPDSKEGRKQYIVEFTYTASTKNENYYTLTLENEFYYEKTLKLVPKKQFKYYQFKQKDSQFKFVLPTQFNYCHDPDRYLVFVNGIKIDRTEYTITIMNKDRPFDSLVLYLSTILDSGDYIDVFYVPEVLEEKYKKDYIYDTGLAVLNDYPTDYPLSKYNTMVFVNGLKINPLDIKDIDMNHLLINVDMYKRDEDDNIVYDDEGNPIVTKYHVNSINNFTCLKYITGNSELSGYLYDSGTATAYDGWKAYIAKLMAKFSDESLEAGLTKIYGPIHKIQDESGSYKQYFAGLRSILYEIILDYYLTRTDSFTNESFVYDFERDYFDPDTEPDTEDVIKIINIFPDHDKLLDYITN